MHALYIRPPYAIDSRWSPRLRGVNAVHTPLALRIRNGQVLICDIIRSGITSHTPYAQHVRHPCASDTQLMRNTCEIVAPEMFHQTISAILLRICSFFRTPYERCGIAAQWNRGLNTRYFPWYQGVTRTRPMTVLCPWQTPKLSRLTASPQVLITTGTRIMTCFHVCFTSLPRVPPVVVRGLKFWAVQNFLPRPTPFRFSPRSATHVYKSTVAHLKLDINANNTVCFTGDHFLTGFGCD